MLETCMNDILLYLGIKKEEKSNFFDELNIYNYKIIINDS